MDHIGILLVGNSTENLLALQSMLTEPDYVFATAQSGEDVLQCVMNADYAMILIDGEVSGANGFETARLIHGHAEARDIPVVFLMPLDVANEYAAYGYAAGATDFICKPFHPDILRAKVKRLSQMHRQRLCLYDQNEMLEWLLSQRSADLIRANRKVIRSNRRLAGILDSITDAFVVIDKNWRFTFVNKEAQRKFNRTKRELIGHTIYELFGKDQIEHEELQRAMSDQTVVTFEFASPVTQRCYIVRAYPSRDSLTLYIQEITERKALEREMLRLERLHLVGEMAAGIAHEIRNPMTTVRGYLQFLRHKFCGYEEQITMMIAELDRANSIISEFLGLAKNKVSQLSPCDLSKITASLFPLIQAEANLSGKDVQIAYEEVLWIKADQGEISQLILNIAKNGLESMPAGGLLNLAVCRDDQAAVLTIADQGSGISPEALEKIGTPFFTTKESGTGLGLAVCYSIAARHGATIEVETNDGGTTFTVRFPFLQAGQTERFDESSRTARS